MELRKLLPYGLMAMSLVGNTLAVDADTEEGIAAATAGLSLVEIKRLGQQPAPRVIIGIDEEIADEEEGTSASQQVARPPQTREPFSESSIVVGCKGHSYYVIGPLGDLMRGPSTLTAEFGEFKKYKRNQQNIMPNRKLVPGEGTAIWEIERERYGRTKLQCLPPHNHPGITVDTLPSVGREPHRHHIGDWLLYPGQSASVEAVFLEELPPAGHCGSKPTFMCDAIAKAYDVLKQDGRLVIHLALDIGFHRMSEKELEAKRSINPFMGYLHTTSVPRMLKGYFKKNSRNDATVVAAVNFYELKIKKLLVDTFGERAGGEKYDKLYNPYTLITDFSVKGLNNGTRNGDILVDIYKLVSVFEQRDLMIKYLTNNDFKEPELRWLDAGQHPYSPSGGWFITAIRA